MTDAAPSTSQTAKSRPRISNSIKLLLGLSIGLMVAGLVLPMLTAEPPKPPPEGVSSLSNAVVTAQEPAQSAWSPALFRLGFSFFVAFAVAFALRTVFKLALLATGFMALVLFGLQYAGLVEIKMAAFSREYDQASHWLTSQFSSMKTLITGYLPSGGAAAAGFFAGFRKGS